MPLAATVGNGRAAKLQDATFGLYGVVPASTQRATVKTDAVYCLRQRYKAPNGPSGADADTQAVNPLSPYLLIYIHAEGAVRNNFAAPKQVLQIFRALCQSKTEPYADLCALLDASKATKSSTDFDLITWLVIK